MNAIAQHPFLSYAFRPFYLLAAIWGGLSVFLWAWGFQGTVALPSFIWHVREMIWGYSAAIVVGFLLTAVATWTGEKPTQGMYLLFLVATFIGSRLLPLLESGLWLSAICNILFVLLSIWGFAHPIIKKRNQRNYLPIVLLALFLLTGVAFDVAIALQNYDFINDFYTVGLLMMMVLIQFIAMRVLPFFTARRLAVPQVHFSLWLVRAVVYLPIIASICLLTHRATPLAAAALLVVVLINIYCAVRWWSPGILQEPLLWVLHLAYFLASVGLLLLALSLLFHHEWARAGIHLIGLGGIGLMSLGMMVRTALGHTGRQMKMPSLMLSAFVLMILAMAFRLLAIFVASAYGFGIGASSICFALSLALYCYRYAPWLWQKRPDKDNVMMIRPKA